MAISLIGNVVETPVRYVRAASLRGEISDKILAWQTSGPANY
ncbi:MAG TPA: hypothetical protein VM555_07445 [Tahibacter sp.]|nr:hypothetical protein [Tahibacter sp.]